MATTAFAVLLLAALVALGRPPTRPAWHELPAYALHGAVVLSRLSARHRDRLRPLPDAPLHARPPDLACRDQARPARGPRPADVRERASSA